MELNSIVRKKSAEEDKKLVKRYLVFEKLIEELRKKDIPSEITSKINHDIEAFNLFSGSNKQLRKLLGKTQARVLRLLEKELKLVPKNHYRRTWMAIGMSVFGVPIGVAFGATQDNYGFIGIGLVFGMGIGIAIGSGMDKKALAAGKQLDIEIG